MKEKGNVSNGQVPLLTFLGYGKATEISYSHLYALKRPKNDNNRT